MHAQPHIPGPVAARDEILPAQAIAVIGHRSPESTGSPPRGRLQAAVARPYVPAGLPARFANVIRRASVHRAGASAGTADRRWGERRQEACSFRVCDRL